MQAVLSTGAVPRKRFVSNSRESVRMFRLGWMEALSKVYWWVPPLVYSPLVVLLLIHAAAIEHVAPGSMALWFVGGMLTWTPTEYVLHRWAFHYEPRAQWSQRLHFIIHGVHHDYPNDAYRLVMPPSASLPITMMFYGLFYLVLPASGLQSFVAGFMSGYVAYDLMHYALHHASWRMPWFAWLKRNHMQHHFVEPDRRYGVSSPLWDIVLRSRGRS
ncbi:sterol desaturase family protein [Solimonas terrae]|uniref:Fatty acid hydroxylase n=1 Tax=Solimonas terrae TaxID=1396819 RepID=A0A6M2BNP4_9GAMM|nr:sterol desaturase family protein [Solimonas terrae]NGY03643.1 fatty acid hydroxylase [Solimonas terrae]